MAKWREDGWKDAGSHECICPDCGAKVSKNAFARKAHRGSKNCQRRAADPPPVAPEQVAPVRPPPPETFGCDDCGQRFPWKLRCRVPGGFVDPGCLRQRHLASVRAVDDIMEAPHDRRTVTHRDIVDAEEDARAADAAADAREKARNARPIVGRRIRRKNGGRS